MITEQDRLKLLERRKRSSLRFQEFIDREAPDAIILHEIGVLGGIIAECKQAGIEHSEYHKYITKETK